METLARSELSLLLNALYDTGHADFSVAHPGDDVGELFEVSLEGPQSSTVSITTDDIDLKEATEIVEMNHGDVAADEIPSVQAYRNAFLAGGLASIDNRGEIEAFLERHGYPDLSAGHRPVLAGMDTNLLAWRPADRLGLDPTSEAVNGFALATGVRDELQWDYKRSDTTELESAFGPQFEELWNQPAGSNREGRLAERQYRQLRDHRYAEELVSERGDEGIVAAYDEFQREGRKDVVLFSNDRDFVERARSRRVPAKRVGFPQSVADSYTGSWRTIQDTLYVLAVLFGVLVLPKVTIYGVWRSKRGQDWHDERIGIECRSPKIEPLLERDRTIIERRSKET